MSIHLHLPEDFLLPAERFPSCLLLAVPLVPPCFWNCKNFLSVCIVISSVVPAADFFPPWLPGLDDKLLCFWLLEVTDFLPFTR